MIDITNKQRGNCGLGIAIGYFSTNGYTVSIPLNDTQDYDLLIDKDDKIKSVYIFVIFLFFCNIVITGGFIENFGVN